MNRLASKMLLIIPLLAVVLAGFTPAAAVDLPFKAGIKYFEVRQADGSYEPMLVKGVNIGAAMPGKFPSEFSYDKQLYKTWLKHIGDMNANVVRLYTMLPPEFYRAFEEHNIENPDNQLWLIQGVWVSPPPERDYLDAVYMADVGNTLRVAADIVHGDAIVHPRPGHAEGIYDADVSPWLLAWLVGREWEPDDIQGFNAMYPDYNDYSGQSISCYGGEPIECWLAELCDIIVSYESDEYLVQRPVSFSSWPPTDPLTHVSESNMEFEDEMEMDESQGRVDIFSNDAVSMSARTFSVEEGFLGGLYASYHVYTYYPDFIDNDPDYQIAHDRYGPSNYAGYLTALKDYYAGMPLLIAEMGLANTMLPAHQQRQGWHHGGMTEQQVADELPRMIEAVVDTGCAGGIVFAWIDEWWKKVWLWAEMYDPFEDIRLWYNCLDPEQNFGLVALRPGAGGPVCTLSGAESEWVNAFYYSGDTDLSEQRISALEIQHDEGYLYLRATLEGFNDWNFKDHGFCLALDIIDQDAGNFSLPGPLNLTSDSGMEIAVVIQNGTARLLQTKSFRYWQPYRVPFSTLPQVASTAPYKLDSESNPRHWVEPVVETNRRRVGKDGTIYPARTWPVNPLPKGSLVKGRDYNDQTVWNADSLSRTIEIRLPWALAGFVGPHKHRVLASEDGNSGSTASDGVAAAAVLFEPTGDAISTFPASQFDHIGMADFGRYLWQPWTVEDINYHIHYKPVYYSLKQLFKDLQLSDSQPDLLNLEQSGD